MDPLKVEIEAVKEESGVLVTHIIISFSFWYDSCHHSTDLEPDRVRKDVLVKACLGTLIFASVSNGL